MNINFSTFFITSIKLTYKAYCSEGYYGSYCNIHCPGNITKCVRNSHTYCKMGKTGKSLIYFYALLSKTLLHYIINLFTIGWIGTDCDEDVDECYTRAFCGHGNCTNTVGSFHCSCPPSVYGIKCQLDEDECLNKSCNGGLCVNTAGSYKCLCKPGMTGKDCEALTSTACHAQTCHHHGTCQVVDGNAVCSCNKGFHGTDCSMHDYCAENPCKHGGVCSSNKHSYVCQCPHGYKGTHCEIVDFCLYTPCSNFGNCTNTGSDYVCSCTEEYFGRNCDIKNVFQMVLLTGVSAIVDLLAQIAKQ